MLYTFIYLFVILFPHLFSIPLPPWMLSLLCLMHALRAYISVETIEYCLWLMCFYIYINRYHPCLSMSVPLVHSFCLYSLFHLHLLCVFTAFLWGHFSCFLVLVVTSRGVMDRSPHVQWAFNPQACQSQEIHRQVFTKSCQGNVTQHLIF